LRSHLGAALSSRLKLSGFPKPQSFEHGLNGRLDDHRCLIRVVTGFQELVMSDRAVVVDQSTGIGCGEDRGGSAP
jgi:hypothetical protein